MGQGWPVGGWRVREVSCFLEERQDWVQTEECVLLGNGPEECAWHVLVGGLCRLTCGCGLSFSLNTGCIAGKDAEPKMIIMMERKQGFRRCSSGLCVKVY